MAINKKLIHFLNKTNFDVQNANNNILPTSICFIKDTKEIFTHDTFYKAINWAIIEDTTVTNEENKES